MPRRRFSRVLPMRALIPNAITLAALCFGLTGVRFAIAGDFERAILAVVIAGVLDGIDGRVARLLKGQSRFGAELDSLSDLTAHGVAPALIIYLWSLQNLSIPGITGGWLKIGNIGWIVALAHAACCALRLARFNANLDVDDQPHKRAGFLTGVPAPVGAGLTLSPIFLDLWLETAFFRQPRTASASDAYMRTDTSPPAPAMRNGVPARLSASANATSSSIRPRSAACPPTASYALRRTRM